MRPFGDRVYRYAVEPGLKAGGVAAFVIMLATIFHALPAPPRGPRFGTIFVGTFFAVALPYIAWRIFCRARNPSLYRPTGRAWTIDEDQADARRIAIVGLVAGCLIVGVVWVMAA